MVQAALPRINPIIELDPRDVQKGIYWKTLGELDLYTFDQKVKSYKGNTVDYALRLLSVYRVSITEME